MSLLSLCALPQFILKLKVIFRLFISCHKRQFLLALPHSQQLQVTRQSFLSSWVVLPLLSYIIKLSVSLELWPEAASTCPSCSPSSSPSLFIHYLALLRQHCQRRWTNSTLFKLRIHLHLFHFPVISWHFCWYSAARPHSRHCYFPYSLLLPPSPAVLSPTSILPAQQHVLLLCLFLVPARKWKSAPTFRLNWQWLHLATLAPFSHHPLWHLKPQL